jgi:hypothetical protein
VAVSGCVGKADGAKKTTIPNRRSTESDD